MRSVNKAVALRGQVLPSDGGSVVVGRIVGMVHVANRDPVARVHHPIGFGHIEIEILMERDGVGVAGGESELCDYAGGHRHRRWQVSVHMLNGPEEEELVTDDPSAAVGKVRIQIDVGSWLSRREQLRTGAERCSPKDKPALSVVIVRSGLCDRVEHRTDGVAEFRRETIRYLLHLFHVRVGYRDQADARAIAFRVVAAIDFVIDAAVKPVRIDLARNPEFSVRDSADVRLKENEVVRVA